MQSLSDLYKAKVAVNSYDSLSGHLLLALTLGREIYASTSPTYTGSHMNSIAKVALGDAEAAAIDCVTFAHAEK